MKKRLSLIVLLGVLLSGVLVARPGGGFVNPPSERGKGGFHDPAQKPKFHTIAEAKALPDDSKVALRGTIVEKLKGDDDKYLFKVDEETIVVEIDDDKWLGQVVTPDDIVTIFGEVDKDDGKVKIDVKKIHKHDESKGKRSKKRQS